MASMGSFTLFRRPPHSPDKQYTTENRKGKIRAARLNTILETLVTRLGPGRGGKDRSQQALSASVH